MNLMIILGVRCGLQQVFLHESCRNYQNLHPLALWVYMQRRLKHTISQQKILKVSFIVISIEFKKILLKLHLDYTTI